MVLAITSHLPHLIAYNIVNTAAHLERVTDSEVIKFSAGGFRDFTRIAASDPTMWRDVFLNNKEAVLEMLGRFSEDLTALQRAIRFGDGETLFRLFTERARPPRHHPGRAGYGGAGFRPRAKAEAVAGRPRRPEAERQAPSMAQSRAATIWVFAYGSLMWRPGFPFAEARHARLVGWRRASASTRSTIAASPARPGPRARARSRRHVRGHGVPASRRRARPRRCLPEGARADLRRLSRGAGAGDARSARTRQPVHGARPSSSSARIRATPAAVARRAGAAHPRRARAGPAATSTIS